MSAKERRREVLDDRGEIATANQQPIRRLKSQRPNGRYRCLARDTAAGPEYRTAGTLCYMASSSEKSRDDERGSEHG